MIKKTLQNTLLFIIGCSCLILPRLKAPLEATVAKPKDFSALQGWEKSRLTPSFKAFQTSCKKMLKQSPDKPVHTALLHLKMKDWQPACLSALRLNHVNEQTAHQFFQSFFTPVAFYQNKPLQGTFTGYYMPSIPGSLVKSKEYTVPIYGKPRDLVIVPNGKRSSYKRKSSKGLLSYYSRREIDNGIIAHSAPVIAWVKSPVDRLFLEIEGSGLIKLDNGKKISVTYAAENGQPYRSIASILISKGIMTKDNASYAHIKRYLESHPQQMNALMALNPSFVFFQKTKSQKALGAQGVPLTDGYSLAVDRRYIPMGAPMWLHTNNPVHQHQTSFKRLMIAQDTGGAIKGMIRGDIFLGSGNVAEKTARHVKHQGQYWMLLPRHIASQLRSQVLKQSKYFAH